MISGFIDPQAMAIRLGRTGNSPAPTPSPGRRIGDWPIPRRRCCTTAGCTSSPTPGWSRLDASNGPPVYHRFVCQSRHTSRRHRCWRVAMLYFPTEEGDVVVASVGPALNVVATNTLTDQSFVASAVADGDIFLRSRTPPVPHPRIIASPPGSWRNNQHHARLIAVIARRRRDRRDRRSKSACRCLRSAPGSCSRQPTAQGPRDRRSREVSHIRGPSRFSLTARC